MDSILERIWPIPPASKRQNGLIPIRWMHPAFRLDVDSEYLCYRAFCVALAINLTLALLLYADYYFQAGVFVSTNDFHPNKLFLTFAFQHLLLTPTAAMSILLYLRLRLPMDIKHDTIPITVLRSALVSSPRGSWIRWALFGITISVALPIWGYHGIDRFVLHYHGANSLFTIALMQLTFQLVGTTAVPIMFTSAALILEKSIRFFPEAKRDLEQRPK